MKSSQSIWHFLRHVKSISSIFVAFLENMNFKKGRKIFHLHQKRCLFWRLAAEKKKPFYVQLEIF